MVDKRNLHEDEEVVLETEEATPSDIELEDTEELSAAKMKQLRDKLKACDEEKRQILEDMQRARADFLNSKKRIEEQLQRDKERITERHIEDLLPLCDSFEMAMNDPKWTEADDSWRKGVEGIAAKLQNILKGYGAEKIAEGGVPFDPIIHDAVLNQPVDDENMDGKVVAVLQSGYKIGERVIRHAKVAVGTKG